MVTFNRIHDNATKLDRKWPGRKTFSARTIAEVLEVRYEDFIAMVRCGAFPAWKESGVWAIPMWERGCPLEWAENRRYDVARRFRAGRVPVEALLEELVMLVEKKAKKEVSNGL
jgi:hypothetical protein